ncbi:helix-hairpin-helix domain-containing protein [Candidatus Pacearchaeota archaeon]|nr:helix-hairpin-helix domain-containing protein [Candidatus Pacearchaeota archaeon]
MKQKLCFLLTFLVFLFGIQSIQAVCDEGQIDINSAPLEDLDKITWVGPATAEKIIAARPFGSVDDLIDVSGIGEVKLDDIKSQGLVCVENEEKEDTKKNDESNVEEEKSNSISGNVVNEEQTDNLESKQANIIAPTIFLNEPSENTDSKGIKDDNDNISDINKYAMYGFIAFCVFIVLLFVLRRNKIKNEIV